MTELKFFLENICRYSIFTFFSFSNDGHVIVHNCSNDYSININSLFDVFPEHADQIISLQSGQTYKCVLFESNGYVESLTSGFILFVRSDTPNSEDALNVIHWFCTRYDDFSSDIRAETCTLLHDGKVELGTMSIESARLLRLVSQTTLMLRFIGQRDLPIYESKNIAGSYHECANVASRYFNKAPNKLIVDSFIPDSLMYLGRIEQTDTALSCFISTAMRLTESDAHLAIGFNLDGLWMSMRFLCSSSDIALQTELPITSETKDLTLPLINEVIRAYGGKFVLKQKNGIVDLMLTIHPKYRPANDGFFFRSSRELRTIPSMQFSLEFADLHPNYQ